MPPASAQVQAACLRPDGSLCSIPISLRNLVVTGTSSMAECGERLAQQLSFGHFAVPGDVMKPEVRLSEVAGVSVMVLQMRNLDRGYLLAVRPSKGLPPFPENTVANRMLHNQQLRVFGCALVMRHTYSAQTATNSYIPVSIADANALIQALPGSAALLAEAQKLAAARKAERELVQEFTARPLGESAAAAAKASGQSFSLRSFGMTSGGSAARDAASLTATAAKASAKPAPKAQPPVAKPTSHPTPATAQPKASQAPPPAAKAKSPVGAGTSRLPEPCPICANTYQLTRHMKQKAKCCKQRVCSECSTEVLKLAGERRAPCPFCRHRPLEVQTASDLEDEPEVEEARQARLAEDRQLAQVLQHIEDEGMETFASRLRQNRQNPTRPAKTWLSVAHEGRVTALEAEVAQLRALLGARQAMPRVSSTSGSSATNQASGYAPALKTVLCRYYEAGRCSQGSACAYAHGKGELRRADSAHGTPATYKTLLCEFHERGMCRRGSQCTFAHGRNELRTTSGQPQGASGVAVVHGSGSASALRREPANYKTLLCEFYERGSCKYGSQCTFAHGRNELRATSGQTQGSSSAVKTWLAARSLCCQAGLGTLPARSMEGQTEIAAWRQRLQDAKSARQGFAFPASLSPADRKVIHLLCEELGIVHESRGEGADRRIHVSFERASSHGSNHSDYEDYDDFFDSYGYDPDSLSD
ncbi:unnamed protein product [Effrenium voratum]|uniref:RING-type E3 ubiquitin transferase n=1 Tax=Effrenium voratum TaxID=2562239 RepID=A0AA36HR22_9DINO|nr:unnamed protein product [Effrenium voratum]CAJ1437207.1 unnamed protein product [Effrenium voratum]